MASELVSADMSGTGGQNGKVLCVWQGSPGKEVLQTWLQLGGAPSRRAKRVEEVVRGRLRMQGTAGSKVPREKTRQGKKRDSRACRVCQKSMVKKFYPFQEGRVSE